MGTVIPYEEFSLVEVRWRKMVKAMFVKERVFPTVSSEDTAALMDANLALLQIFVQVRRFV